ncbi:hypothetical protein NKH18_21610 [Streptomyces sp. M10(2022)]
MQPGQPLDDTWTVTRVLGTGATARALLVRRAGDGSEGQADSRGSSRSPSTTRRTPDCTRRPLPSKRSEVVRSSSCWLTP